MHKPTDNKAEKCCQKVCFLGRLVSDGREDRQVAVLFLYRRFHGWTRGAGLLQEPDSNWNSALEMESSMQESQTVSQLTLKSWIFTSMHRRLPSTWPKRHVRGSELSISSPLASHSYTMLICLNDLFACSDLTQIRKLLTYFSKNSFYLLPEPLRPSEFLTNYCNIQFWA